MRTFAFGLAFAMTVAHAQAQVSQTQIEKRAECITNEGGDIPVGVEYKGPPAPVNEECAASVLDGTRCDSLADAAEKTCLRKDLAVWDGVLDKLVVLSAGRTKRETALKDSIAAFRKYRDSACTTFTVIAVNPPGANAIGSCRVRESARFAQKLYPWFYSP